MKRLTLSDRLAALTDPSPVDVDPEEPIWDSASMNYDNYEEQDLDAVGTQKFKEAPNKRRMVGDVVMGPEYRGKKVSRKALLDERSGRKRRRRGDVEEEGEEEEEDGGGLSRPRSAVNEETFQVNLGEESSEEEEEEEEEKEEDDSDSGYLHTGGSQNSKLNEEEDEDEGNDILMSNQALNRQKEADELEEIFQKAQQEEQDGPQLANLENQTQKASHTMNQYFIWNSLIDIRINFQHLLDLGNRLPSPEGFKLLESLSYPEVKEGYGEVREVLTELLERMGSLQLKLMVNDLSDNNVSATGNIGEDYVNWNKVVEIQKMIEETSTPILEKWHTKVLLPSVTSGRNSFKLKTINQTIMNQVDATLSGRALESLLQRTQVVPENLSKMIGQEGDVKVASHPEIYNDEDFYAALLNERIQAGEMHISSDPLKMSQQYLRLRQLRKRKKKNEVEQRATKGRKIRYKLHEKLINFMAPVDKYPNSDSLMAQTLSKSLFGLTPTQSNPIKKNTTKN